MRKTTVTTDISEAATQLLEGGIIGFPTETVYGLAGIIDSETAISTIFRVKGRPSDNPLIVHIAHPSQLDDVAAEVPELAWQLSSALWPGPLTMLLKKRSSIPDAITAGRETVAVRMPAHPAALALLSAIGQPVAAPSANPFGCISPSQAQHVLKYFDGKIPLILDGGPCQVGIESTIVGFDGPNIIIYRHGSVTAAQIAAVTDARCIYKQSGPKVVAPGMFPRHYAPVTPLLFSNNIQELAQLHSGKKIGLLHYGEHFSSNDIVASYSLSSSDSMEEAAANLYSALHKLDNYGLDLILVKEFPMEGIGIALNDKLKRASYQQ
ncbi:L-threonylcarbamoyladenylate synthase [Flavobacterium sp.]|uniref:L-threonylcarbamoyladenylate synthase n=1 Tax=Flavobacterium sp. TaxID=239 RepID=UPI0040345136